MKKNRIWKALAFCGLLVPILVIPAAPAGALGPPLFPNDYTYTATVTACDSTVSASCTLSSSPALGAAGDDVKIDFNITCNTKTAPPATLPGFGADHCENRPFIAQLAVGSALGAEACQVEGDLLQFNPLVNFGGLNAQAKTAEPVVGGMMLAFKSVSVGTAGSFTIPEHPNVDASHWAATNSDGTAGGATSTGEITAVLTMQRPLLSNSPTGGPLGGYLCVSSAESYGDASYTNGSNTTSARGYPYASALGVGAGIVKQLDPTGTEPDPYCQPACTNLDMTHRFFAAIPVSFS